MVLSRNKLILINLKDEAEGGIEPPNRGFADLGLTTWLPRRIAASTSPQRGLHPVAPDEPMCATFSRNPVGLKSNLRWTDLHSRPFSAPFLTAPPEISLYPSRAFPCYPPGNASLPSPTNPPGASMMP